MPLRTVYHLNIDSDQIEGATVRSCPATRAASRPWPHRTLRAREGARVQARVPNLDRLHRQDAGPRDVDRHRGPRRRLHRRTGQLGVRTFLRSAPRARSRRTSTSHRRDHDGSRAPRWASTHYAPIEYPAVAHPDVVQPRRRPALSACLPDGVSASCDTFYPARSGTTRSPGTSAALPRHHGGVAPAPRAELRNGVVHVLTLTAAMGCAAVCPASSSTRPERERDEGRPRGWRVNAVRVAVRPWRASRPGSAHPGLAAGVGRRGEDRDERSRVEVPRDRRCVRQRRPAARMHVYPGGAGSCSSTAGPRARGPPARRARPGHAGRIASRTCTATISAGCVPADGRPLRDRRTRPLAIAGPAGVERRWRARSRAVSGSWRMVPRFP